MPTNQNPSTLKIGQKILITAELDPGYSRPFGGPKLAKSGNKPALTHKVVPTCPACERPFVENEKFSICRHCPYRIAPKPVQKSETKTDWC